MSMVAASVVLLVVILVVVGAMLYGLTRRRAATAGASATMGGGWLSVGGEMIAGICAATIRFPVTSLLLVAMALDANLSIAELIPDGVREDELFVALLSAAALSLAGTLFGESRRLRWAVTQAVAAVAGLAGFALGWWNEPFSTYLPAYMAALAGLVVVAPYFGRGTSATFWMFAVRLSFAAILAGLALLLFAGGISAILASLTFLFGLDVPGDLYAHVWTTTGLLAAPLFGLGQLPRDFDLAPDDTAGQGFANEGMRALGDFVAAPLLLVYAAILHAYAAKIVVTGEVPEGQIGWLVLGFGFCVFGVLIVIHPFLDKSRAPTRLLMHIWPFLLPVPLALLFYAAALRIADYGLTPERYLLVLFGAVTVVSVLLQMPARTRGDIRWLSALPVLALLIGSFGPQGAVGLSVASQASRFRDIVADKPLDAAENGEALSALQFLDRYEALDRVTPADLPADAAGPSLYRRVAKAYGLNPDLHITRDGAATFNANFPQAGAISTAGFDLMVSTVSISASAVPHTPISLPSGASLQLTLRGGAIEATRGQMITRFDLPVAELRTFVSGQPVDRPLLRLSDGAREIMIAPTYLYGTAGDTPVVTSLNGALFLRSADWQ